MTTLTCPHCLHEAEYFLPCEPLYDLRFCVAMQLFPLTLDQAYRWLGARKLTFPQRYRLDQQMHKHRVLTASEIKRIRDAIIFEGTAKNRRRAPRDTTLKKAPEDGREADPSEALETP